MPRAGEGAAAAPARTRGVVMDKETRGRLRPGSRRNTLFLVGAFSAALAAGAAVGLLAGQDPPAAARTVPASEPPPAAPPVEAPELPTEGLWTAGAFLAVLVGAALFLVRRGPRLRAGGRQVRLVESLPLGPRRRLHVVRCGDRRYLIGDSERGLTYIATLEPLLEDEANRSPGEGEPSFDDVLGRREGWR